MPRKQKNSVRGLEFSQTLSGHDNFINRIAWSPGGERGFGREYERLTLLK